jgi:hypothetical protein
MAVKGSNNNSTVGSSTRNLHKRKQTSICTESPERKEIHEGIKRAKEWQTVSVNKQTENKTEGVRKEALEVNEVCTLILEGKAKAPFPYLACMITNVMKNRYSLCTRDGHLRGTFNRNQLDYRPTYNGSILGIDTYMEGFRKNMSVQEACKI